ncbi:rhodanese-like domain-containing protein [Sulfobacillus thermosulfidooxidans]|uniref:rhodanese-like domain-containing protein n=1 Tax=Sulfobacillus thermosulfidooxidans TaxID=28034 RepID=UPI0006864EDC|nr:rhodanese-like domain-containing protein [Sulfobacillus thermosulfidooxidans]
MRPLLKRSKTIFWIGVLSFLGSVSAMGIVRPVSHPAIGPDSPYGVNGPWKKRLVHYFRDAAIHHAYQLNASALKSLMAQSRKRHQPLLLLDVRQTNGPEGFRQGHIVGARNIPLQSFGPELMELVHASPTSPLWHEPIVVMCYDGDGANLVTVILRLFGFHAWNLRGGIGTWNQNMAGWLHNAPINWPTMTGNVKGLPVISSPKPGPDRLPRSLVRAVSTIFTRLYHPYPLGYGYPWTIDSGTLYAALHSAHAPEVIDLRSTEEFRRGHIAGSINIPFAALGQHLNLIHPKMKVVLVSQTLQTAAQANAILRLLGYHSYVLKMGMAGWQPSTFSWPISHNFPLVQG